MDDTEDVEDRIPNIGDDKLDDVTATFSDFEEIEKIGAGGNADVTKVELQTKGPDEVAMKQPRMEGTLDGESIEKFVGEAETWNKIDDHNHIVGVLSWNSDPLPWIALEYMDGGDLSDRISDMEIEEALWVGICVAKAVRHAHRRGIAHLDLKPENILFKQTDDDQWDIPKVTDWGLAKMLVDHSKSVEGLSPEYAPPEQFDSSTYGPADDMSDIYAVGAVVYAALTGEPPFTGASSAVMNGVLTEEPEPPSEKVEDLPEGTDAVVLKALSKDKNDRYESILDLRRDLTTLFERATDEDDGSELIAEAGKSASIVSGSVGAGGSTTGNSDNRSIVVGNREFELNHPDDSPNEGLRRLSYLSLGYGGLLLAGIIIGIDIPGIVYIGGLSLLMPILFIAHGASLPDAEARPFWGGVGLYSIVGLVAISSNQIVGLLIMLTGIFFSTQGGEPIEHPEWVPEVLQEVVDGEDDLRDMVEEKYEYIRSKVFALAGKSTTDTESGEESTTDTESGEESTTDTESGEESTTDTESGENKQIDSPEAESD